VPFPTPPKLGLVPYFFSGAVPKLGIAPVFFSGENPSLGWRKKINIAAVPDLGWCRFFFSGENPSLDWRRKINIAAVPDLGWCRFFSPAKTQAWDFVIFLTLAPSQPCSSLFLIGLRRLGFYVDAVNRAFIGSNEGVRYFFYFYRTAMKKT
jgi:hypothetical protein